MPINFLSDLASPSFVTPILGTPSSGTLTSCVGLPIVNGTTGTLSVARGGTGVITSTGTGNNVLSASPTFTGSVTIGSLLTFANPGIGQSTKFVFSKTNDSAWLDVKERSADKTYYEFGMADNPTSSDYFQWKMNSWEGAGIGWMPLQIGAFTNRFVASSNKIWGNVSMPVNTSFATVNNSTTSDVDYEVLKYTPTNSTTQTLYKDSGTGTGTVILNAASFTGTSKVQYWIKIDTGGTSFSWGTTSNVSIATGVTITGTAQTLNYGVTVTLSTTNHVANDKWTWVSFPRPTSAIGGNPTTTAMQTIFPAAGIMGQVIKGASGQTANLQEWQDSSATVLASIGSTGNVGIGTASPVGKLEVQTVDANRYIRFKAPNGEERFEFYTGGTGNYASQFMYDADGTTRNVQISAGGTSYFNGGNVGIGTSSPTNTLDVRGAASSSGTTLSVDSTYGEAPKTLQFTYNGDIPVAKLTGWGRNAANYLPYFAIEVNDTTSSVVSSNTAERLRILANGNVGIGTTTPESKLHIAGVNGEAFRWSNSSTVYGKLSCGTAGARIDVTGANSGYGLSFSMDDSTKMIILPSGNVGIGTATPAQKLDVVGSIAISENIELGHASDTTITRVSAGKIAVEGKNVVTTDSTDTLTNKTLTAPTITGAGAIAGVFTGNITGNVIGNATSATTALTATTAQSAASITATANNTTNETTYITFIDGATGPQGIETDTDLTYNPSTNVLTAGTFAGALSGNADTATKLATAVNIGGVSFDGSANIPQRQVTHHSATFTFAVNTKQYIGLLDSDSESTAASNINLPFLAPFSGKLLKIFLRSGNNLTGGNLTLRLEKNALDVNAGGTPTVVTNNPAAQLGPSNSTMKTYDWTSLSNTINAGDMIFISIASDTVFSSVKIFFTCLWEWDH
jgi:hypothetical protein